MKISMINSTVICWHSKERKRYVYLYGKYRSISFILLKLKVASN